MKLIQYTGPFIAGKDSISISKDMNYKIVHIGFTCPDTWPIEFLAHDYQDNYSKYCDVKLNGQVYHICDLGILEFDNLAETYVEIEFLRDLPFGTIIDIAYEQMEV